MLVLVPVGGGAFNDLLDLGPDFEASPFQGQGVQHFPPRLNQVQVRCILGLKDELPARVKQAEQQNIRRAVRFRNTKSSITLLLPHSVEVVFRTHRAVLHCHGLLGQRLSHLLVQGCG